MIVVDFAIWKRTGNLAHKGRDCDESPESLVDASRAALEALNEIAGSALALEHLVKTGRIDERVAKILRANSLSASEAALKLKAALD